MKVSIDFNGVTDHIDIIDEEIRKSRILMNYMQHLISQIPAENYELFVLKGIVASIESLERNMQGRKVLLKDIVDEFKKVKISNKAEIEKMESIIKALCEGK